MTRANARELAVHLIYGRAFTGEEPEEVVAIRLNKEYYNKLAAENQVYEERPSRTQMAYIGWDITRISKLARTIMQLAIFEILYMDDVPTGVAISEAVRLAKMYDGDDTGAFVNGILGAFSRNMETEVNE